MKETKGTREDGGKGESKKARIWPGCGDRVERICKDSFQHPINNHMFPLNLASLQGSLALNVNIHHQICKHNMTLPDYASLGFKDIIISLDGAVAVIVINRPKQ